MPVSPCRFFLCFIALCLVFFGQALYFLCANSQTFDEAIHLAAGYSYITSRDFRLNPEHPPLLKELAALPVYLLRSSTLRPVLLDADHPDQFVLGREFLYHQPTDAEAVLTLARLPNALLGVLLLALIARWSYRLWGSGASMLATALAAVDPNLIANASLVTMDLGATLFFGLTWYQLWEYAAPHPQPLTPPGRTEPHECPERRRSLCLIAAVGVMMGLALAAKYSMVLLPCLAIPLLVLHEVTREPPPVAKPECRRLPTLLGWFLRRLVGPVLLMLALASLVLCLVYLGQSPATCWTGLRWQLAHADTGHPAYFLGEYSTTGWTWYFPVALLVKTPLGTLLLFGCGLVPWCGRRFTWADMIFFMGPPALFLAVMTQSSINIGVRYVLPVYPFLIVLAGRVATYTFPHAWLTPIACSGCLLLTVVASVRMAPHYLAFFNVTAGGSLGGSRWLLDSNLDWGQDLKLLKRYMDRAGVSTVYLSYFGTAPPDYYGIRFQYLPSFSPQAVSPSDDLVTGERRELLVISVNNLYAVYAKDHEFYRWLRDRPPLDHIGYSLYVYDITNDASAHLELARCYSKVGMMTQMAHEALRVLAFDPSNAEAQVLLRETTQATK